MRQYNRIKPRQSGKTTELIELAKMFLAIGRKIVFLTATKHEQMRIKEALHDYTTNQNCAFGIATNCDVTFRGRMFDTILVDDWDRFSAKAHETILINNNIYRSLLVTTHS